MQHSVTRLILLVVLVVVACRGTAMAFYVDGLMSGMSSTTAQKILEKHGFEVVETRQDGSLVADSKEPAGRRLIAGFCGDRLVQVQNIFEPTFSKFVQLVEQKRQEFGVHTSARVSNDAKTGVSSVSFGWLDQETNIDVVFMESGNTFQVSVYHRVKSSCP